MKRCFQLLSSTSAVGAAVPKNYSNVPYKRDEANHQEKTKRQAPRPSGDSRRREPMMLLATRIIAAAPPVPSPMRSSFIDRSTIVDTHFNHNDRIKSFREAVCRTTDVSMRPLLFLHAQDKADVAAGDNPSAVAQRRQRQLNPANSFGEGRLGELSCRWAAKFYGNVTFGPRNYPYPSSRWLARRFKMKKHRIVKRFRFRRYKLAAVANLPFAKMIRVGMLPELKTSKTKKGDTVDAGLSSQLVNAARASSAGTKEAGKRSRPRSKYQV